MNIRRFFPFFSSHEDEAHLNLLTFVQRRKSDREANIAKLKWFNLFSLMTLVVTDVLVARRMEGIFDEKPYAIIDDQLFSNNCTTNHRDSDVDSWIGMSLKNALPQLGVDEVSNICQDLVIKKHDLRNHTAVQTIIVATLTTATLGNFCTAIYSLLYSPVVNEMQIFDLIKDNAGREKLQQEMRENAIRFRPNMTVGEVINLIQTELSYDRTVDEERPVQRT